jgi:pyroglutamyl-peptidase
MQTLLTGFGPFGTVINNPSERIVAHFRDHGAPGHTLTTQVLPVSFTRADQEIGRLLQTGTFDVCLMLGVAGKASAIRLEQFGRNFDNARIPDCDGFSPIETPIRPGSPATYEPGFPLEPLLAALQAADIPAELSDSAGAYVCNRVYYAALHACAVANIPTRCLFVHIPPNEITFAEPPDTPTMPLGRQIEAIRIVLSELSRT